jgi:uncharacterized protein YjdB
MFSGCRCGSRDRYAPVNVRGKEDVMRVLRGSAIAMVMGVMVFALACGGSSTTPTTVSSVAVTGTPPTVGATSQFKATATMSDNTTLDVTSLASWASSDATIATVSSTGAVTAVAAGAVNVTATYQSVTGTDQIALTN